MEDLGTVSDSVVSIGNYPCLRRCVSEFNSALKAYMLTYIFLLLATLGLFIGLALSVEHLSDLVEIVFFPLYLLMFVTAFCILGQFLSDSVSFWQRVDESNRSSYRGVVVCSRRTNQGRRSTSASGTTRRTGFRRWS